MQSEAVGAASCATAGVEARFAEVLMREKEDSYCQALTDLLSLLTLTSTTQGGEYLVSEEVSEMILQRFEDVAREVGEERTIHRTIQFCRDRHEQRKEE